MSFLLLQLSDSHLSADPEASYRGENADANLKRLLPACRLLKPDGVVLTGDVSEDGSIESYQRVPVLLEGLSERVAWIPGNHDERERMSAVFGPAGYTEGPRLAWGGWQILLLDSARPDRPEGHLDERRLAPLDQMVPGQPALVFVHHQPLPVESPWIDKYPLTEPENLWQRLDSDTVRAIGFGHVHQAFKAEKNGIVCLSAPSTVANSQPGMDKFTPDPTGPKARWYRLHEDGRWQTGLVSVGMG